MGIAQGGAYFIEIVHGDGGGVKTQVSNFLKLFTARFNAIDGREADKRSRQSLLTLRAITHFTTHDPVGVTCGGNVCLPS